LIAEVLVAGLGITPAVDLAEQAGLPVDNGVLVDEFCRTSHPDVYAAGDVANFANPALGTRLRVEHEDNANTMGRTAGVNMAGRGLGYDEGKGQRLKRSGEGGARGRIGWWVGAASSGRDQGGARVTGRVGMLEKKGKPPPDRGAAVVSLAGGGAGAAAHPVTV